MATKHEVKDTDLHFLIDPSTRSINKQYEGKAHLMQYDHNSESLTFEVPRYIEEHDMSLCDVIQIHYENTSTGTSVSMRKTYRDIETVKREDLTVNEETIEFSWLIPETATTFAGMLKFQLKFICYDDESEEVVGYKWHTTVNEDISIVAGLTYSESTLPDSVKATLQTLEVVETEEGVDVILDGATYHIYHGGYASEVLGTTELKANKVDTIDPINENLTNREYPSVKAVQKLFGKLMENGVSVIRTVNGSALKFFVGTQAEYDALEDQQDLFAIISDDATKEEMFTAIETLTQTVSEYTTRIETLETEVDPYGDTLENHEDRIKALEAQPTVEQVTITQDTGSSTTAVMSQKATTDAINALEKVIEPYEDRIAALEDPTFSLVATVTIGNGQTPSTAPLDMTKLVHGCIYLAIFNNEGSGAPLGSTFSGLLSYNSSTGDCNMIGFGVYFGSNVYTDGRVNFVDGLVDAATLTGTLRLYKLGKVGIL